MDGMRVLIRVLVGKSQGKKPFGTSKSVEVYKIKMDF
jgi:hypothetical protein